MAYSINHGGIEVNFTGRTKINFVLLPDANNKNYISVDEGIIYDTGYGKISNKNATRSMNKIDNRKIEENTYLNIYDMIQAKVPGVVVRNKSITIRGPSSMRAQGQPLFVVDGSFMGSIDFINPKEVESITVLKGAAASIYGSRGTFGVIVITMKSGKIMK